jgi:hypothetical protein
MNKMKMSLSATAVVAVIVATFFIGLNQGQLAVQQEIKYPHIVNFAVTRDGTVVYNYTTHNTLTTIGAHLARNVFGFANETATQVKYVALSSDTSPDKSWTKLPNEYTTGGLERKTGTPSVVNATAFQVVASWTSSTTTTIKCTSLHWDGTSGSDNNMWAVATIADASVISGDNVQVTWTVNTPDG